uniref:Fucosyltransferase n=1 Tax=Panagrolaimus davidi TaxID=227884 RepID=A0A914Q5Q6_9BILA
MYKIEKLNSWNLRLPAILSVSVIFLLGWGYFSLSSKDKNSSPNFIPISTSTPNNKTTFLPPINPTTKRLPLILAYNSFFGSSMFSSAALAGIKKCKFECRYSENPQLYPQSDVAIFHARSFRKMDPILSSNSKPERLNVFYALEAAANEKISGRGIPKDFFNVTMTFRRDSTIWRPYDKFEKLRPKEMEDERYAWSDEQINKTIEKKSDLALQFVSNCVTHSRREKYLAALQKYTNITIFGKCNKNVFPYDSSMKKEFEKHYFYLAFENAVCDDYVTEKFWRLKTLIVPVVLKRSILKGIIDDEYFIAADDFDSPEALIEKLESLSQNPEEYKKYFGWTKKFRKTETPRSKLDNFCKLCEMATKKEKHMVPDIYEWWEQKSNCKSNFAKTIKGKNSWLKGF